MAGKRRLILSGELRVTIARLLSAAPFPSPRFLLPSIQKSSKDWLRYEETGLPFVDQLGEYHLGKYTFRDINFLVDQDLPETLIIGKAGEFPAGILPLKTIYYPDGEAAILIVDPSIQTYAKAAF